MTKGLAAGFAGINTGTISESYSLVSVSGRRVFGFCGHNDGGIDRCWSAGSLRGREASPFCGNGAGIRNSFCLAETAPGGSRQDPMARAADSLKQERLEQEQWDLGGVFQKKDGLPVFCADLFSEPEPENGWQTIGSREELFRFAGAVNRGEEAARSGRYRLTCDIDLQGAVWTPVGADETVSFRGSFEGGGHRISGFRVKEKDLEYAGFFGVCSHAQIRRLLLAGSVDGGRIAGGFAAVCDSSELLRCRASVSVRSGGTAAGFAGRNSGTIGQCCAEGRCIGQSLPKPALIPAAVILAAVTASAAGIQIYRLQQAVRNPQVYAPIAPDPYVERVTAQQSAADGGAPAGKNAVSLTFEKTIRADTGTSLAAVRIENPFVNANQVLVVELQLTDRELLGRIGRTGRTAEQQAQIDADPAYDPGLCRVTVAETGAIGPGEGITKLQLHALPDGTALPAGSYEAVLLFSFYDAQTNAKAAVNTQSAAALVIGG